MKEIVTFFVHVKLNLGVAHSWALRRLSVKHALSKLSKKRRRWLHNTLHKSSLTCHKHVGLLLSDLLLLSIKEFSINAL